MNPQKTCITRRKIESIIPDRAAVVMSEATSTTAEPIPDGLALQGSGASRVCISNGRISYS